MPVRVAGAVGPRLGELKASLELEFSLKGLSIATFLQNLEAFEGLELADLEEVIRRAVRVHIWLGETGGGFNLKGKAVVKHRDSQRPLPSKRPNM